MKVLARRLVCMLIVLAGLPGHSRDGAVKKEVKYKEYTEFNFSGQTVQGKSRTPELFYIFQRKRSGGHDAVHIPESFNYHHGETVEALKGALPQ